jgi:hypothetical protein
MGNVPWNVMGNVPDLWGCQEAFVDCKVCLLLFQINK